jgi:hypothetical protein
MARYDRHYDYGLRGRRETTWPRAPRRPYDAALRPERSGDDFLSFDERRAVRPNRVVARYNADYVWGNRGDPYPENYHSFTGDQEERIGDWRYYREPYTTIGGTRTWRGAPQPIDFDRSYDPYDRQYRGRR